MEFISGFSWPLPMAFAAAVAACRFEQGDVLYSAKGAYRSWPGGRRGLSHCIQVLDPPRTARALSADAQGTRFLANWSSPVELERMDLAENRCETLRTTQGRLFGCLWHGDLGRLDALGPEPEPPALLRALQARLPEAEPVVRQRLGLEEPSGPPRRAFLFALDRSSEDSRLKAQTIESRLAGVFEIERLDLDPSRAGLEGGEVFHPALGLRALGFCGRGDVERILEPVLYRAALRAQESAPNSGRPGFRLSRHGLLLEPCRAAGED